MGTPKDPKVPIYHNHMYSYEQTSNRADPVCIRVDVPTGDEERIIDVFHSLYGM